MRRESLIALHNTSQQISYFVIINDATKQKASFCKEAFWNKLLCNDAQLID